MHFPLVSSDTTWNIHKNCPRTANLGLRFTLKIWLPFVPGAIGVEHDGIGVILRGTIDGELRRHISHRARVQGF